MGIIAYLAGMVIGLIIGVAITDYFRESEAQRDELLIEHVGIDPDELIAWIDNLTCNYEEYPTVNQIITKIREMEAEA